MQTLHVHSLLTNSSSYQLNIDSQQPLGTGCQGTVYPVPNTNQVVKLYTTPQVRQHLVPFMRRLQAYRLADNCESLQGLPQDVFTTNEGKVGVIMNRVPGQSLEQTGYQPFKRMSLSQRLILSHRLTNGVATLHEHGFILADLAEANVLYDAQQNHIYLIDIDGGGIMHGQHYRLKPAVWGHDCGSLMPLELRQRRHLPSPASDNWALAVLLHRVLSQPPGADPFFFGQDSRVLEGDTLWPPPVDKQPAAQQPLLARHRAGLARLGPPIREAFKSTFCPLGRHHPEHRVKACHWAQMLASAARWIYHCPICQQEFVAEQTFCCPVCHTPIRHATLTAGKRCISIGQDPFTLTWHQLGLGNAREAVLRFERRHANIGLYVLAGVLSLRFNLRCQVLTAGDSYQIGAGVYSCRFKGTGTDEVMFKLVNPWGHWVTPPLPLDIQGHNGRTSL